MRMAVKENFDWLLSSIEWRKVQHSLLAKLKRPTFRDFDACPTKPWI